MNEWTAICRVQDIPPLGARRVARQRGLDVAIFRTSGDEVFALLDRCPHKGGVLSQGIVFGRQVACPLHNWTIGLDNGAARAELAGAANTLIFDGDEIIGDNTDGVGLLRDITINLGYPVAGKRVLLLGAGGASRGVVGPLLEAGIASLTIANRTVPRAKLVAERFAPLGPVTGCGYDELAGQSFDIVINATSASLSGSMPALPVGIFAPGSLAYKMMYGMGDTPFRIFAREQGAAVISEGLGMLVEQAAESFFVWRGVRPEVRPVMELLQQA